MYLDFLGEGLFRHLAEEFGDLVFDGGLVSMRELEARLREEPGNPARHRDMGRRHLQDANPALARKALTRALQLDPGDLPARMLLACALDGLGRTQTAIEELRACLEARPDYRPAVEALGFCSYKLGDDVAPAHDFELDTVSSHR